MCRLAVTGPLLFSAFYSCPRGLDGIYVLCMAEQTSSVSSPTAFSTLCWLPFSCLPKCVAGKYLLCGLRRYLAPVCPGSHFSALNTVLTTPTRWGVHTDARSQGHRFCGAGKCGGRRDNAGTEISRLSNPPGGFAMSVTSLGSATAISSTAVSTRR